jgi:hypothetical protein
LNNIPLRTGIHAETQRFADSSGNPLMRRSFPPITADLSTLKRIIYRAETLRFVR